MIRQFLSITSFTVIVSSNKPNIKLVLEWAANEKAFLQVMSGNSGTTVDMNPYQRADLRRLDILVVDSTRAFRDNSLKHITLLMCETPIFFSSVLFLDFRVSSVPPLHR